MNYQEVIHYLYGLELFGTKLGLERILRLLRKLGDPQKDLRVIHVAGTNGKGSVCAMISSILKKARYTVGMYTSPHLKHFTERFLIDGDEITKKEVVDLFQKVMIHRTDETFFETITAMAFLYFKEKDVDLLVLEVGLGGRLDATNVVDPIVSVITNISLEHTEYLGNSIEAIAFEKAGIIKKGKPVVTGCKGKALDVIKGICKERDSKLFVAGEDRFDIDLKGEFQQENANVAICVIKVLNGINETKIKKEDMKKGLKKVIWNGRMQFVEKNVLVDCAHNLKAMKLLSKELKKIKKDYNKIVLVIGMMKDKDYKEMLEEITPLADNVILTMVHTERAANPDELKKYVKVEYEIKKDVKEAVNYAKSMASSEDLVVVAGSIYVVGKV